MGTIVRHAMIGVCIGLLTILPHGVGVLYAQEADRQNVRVGSPFLDQLRGIEVGRLRIRPTFSQRFTFDDNIFLNDSGEGEGREEDFISETSAGAAFSFGLDIVQFDARIVPHYRYFLLHPEESTETLEGDYDFGIQIADLLDLDADFASGREGNRLRLDVSNDLNLRSDPLDDNFQPERVARLIDRFKAKVTYELSKKTEASVFYNLTYVESLESDFDRISSLDQQVGIEAKHALTPAIDLVGTAFYGRSNHFEEILNDSQYYQAMAGLEGQLSRRLSFSLQAGVQHRESIGGGSIRDDSDATALVTEGSAVYEIGPDTQLSADVIRTIQLATASNFKTTTIGRLRLNHQFTPKITGIASAEIQHEDPSRGGSSIRYRAGLRFDYRLNDWVKFDLEYQFQLNEAEDRDADFYNNRVTLGMSLEF